MTETGVAMTFVTLPAILTCQVVVFGSGRAVYETDVAGKPLGHGRVVAGAAAGVAVWAGGVEVVVVGAGWAEAELEVEAEKGADPEPWAGPFPGAGAFTRAGAFAGVDALVEAGPLVEVVEAAAPPDGALLSLGVEGGDCEEATRMKTTTMAKSATVPKVKP